MMIQRLVALLVIAISGLMAVIGWNMLREGVFSYFAGQGFLWGTFLGGFFLFAAGLGFLGGFIYYRDKKRNLVKPSFLKKKK